MSDTQPVTPSIDDQIMDVPRESLTLVPPPAEGRAESLTVDVGDASGSGNGPAPEAKQTPPVLDRSTYIGSSDAAMVADLSPWGSPLTVWNRLIGIPEPDEAKPLRFWLGKRLEPIILDLYEMRTGLRPVKVTEDTDPPVLHPGYSFIGAHPDYEQLEIKTARSTYGWGDDGESVTIDNMAIPLHYFLQVQHTLAVMGWRVMDVAVLIGHDEFRRYEVRADAGVIDRLTAAEVELWDYAKRGEPPPQSDGAARKAYLRSKFPVDTDPPRPATPEEQAIVREWREAKDAVAEAEIREQFAADRVRGLIGNASGLIGLVSWKAQMHRSINADALREELAKINRRDILERVTRNTPTRVLRKIESEDA